MRSKLTSEVKVMVKFTREPSAARQDGATRATPGRWSSCTYNSRSYFHVFIRCCEKLPSKSKVSLRRAPRDGGKLSPTQAHLHSFLTYGGDESCAREQLSTFHTHTDTVGGTAAAAVAGEMMIWESGVGFRRRQPLGRGVK